MLNWFWLSDLLTSLRLFLLFKCQYRCSLIWYRLPYMHNILLTLIFINLIFHKRQYFILLFPPLAKPFEQQMRLTHLFLCWIYFLCLASFNLILHKANLIFHSQCLQLSLWVVSEQIQYLFNLKYICYFPILFKWYFFKIRPNKNFLNKFK